METKSKLKSIGTSQFFLVPSEYIKVFNLDEYDYRFEIEDEGKVLKFVRSNKITITTKNQNKQSLPTSL